MSSIDERVVKMRLDNSQFEQGINKTSGLLGKLKQALNLDKSVESINNVDKAVSGVSFSPLTSGLQGVQSGFNAMGAVAFSVLNRMTNAAIDAGKSITNALTASVRDGFAEYETQMNAVQTILANTQSKGSTIDDVNSALDTLNTYADKTIYNFTEMTRNIGTFTAAGVDLQTSVDSIKGIANLAAVSGSSSAQASQAMYQLSQAIAAGKVQLMDWNSVVNAGMGGEVFQEALKRTARNFGTDVDGMIEKYGSFRESLTQGGWLTTDVLTETLKQLSGAYTEADLVSQGYTEEQAKQIIQLANTAEGAATDVKTFSQLIDTTKEALASGWTNTFEIIFGDFEEAKELWSGVADVISDVVNRSSESRNNLLKGWKDLGGRTELIEGLSNVFESLGKVVSTVGNAFRKVFPPTTSRKLMDITEAFTSFTERLIPSESTLNKIGRVAEGVFSVFDIGVQAVKAVGEAIATAFGSDSMGGLLDNLLDIAAGFGDWLVGLDKSIKQFGIFEGAAKGVGTAISGVLGLFSSFTGGISSMGSAIGSIASRIGDVLGGAFERVKNVISDVLTWITDNISGGDIFAGLAGGGIFLATKKLGGAFDKIKDAVEGIFGNGGENLKKGAGVFNDVLSGLQESLNAFTGSVKAVTLVEIAGSIALLVNSMEKIAALSGGEVVGGISAIGGLMTELNVSLKAITKTMKGVKTTDLIKTGVALMEFAKAVDMLANAMSTIGNLDWDEIGKGLTGMGGAMAELVAAAKGLSYAKVDIKTAGSLIAMAQAVKMVADPLKKLGGMSWEEIGKGLSAMGGALAEMGTVTGLLGRFGKNNLSASISMVLTAKSLGDIAEAFGDFSKCNWGEIGRGLVAMGGALGEVGTVTGVLGKLAGFSGILGGGSILITAKSLGDIAEAFGSFTQYNWDEIGRGLVAMGGALGEVAVITGALGKLAGLSVIIGGGSILITAKSLGDIASAFGSFTQYNWGEIGRGLVAMGGALGEVSLITGALGKLAGLSGLIGAGTITLAVQGLDEIARAFNSFAQYSWDEIGRGLVAMGGALGEVAVISGATGALTGIAGLMGAGTITLASQGLIDIATAFGKFTEFNWDEIGRGLAAMAGALGVTALGSLLNTLSGIGAGVISTVAVPLGQLADSVKKWSGVTVPEDLATNLGTLASGVMKFTLGGLGAGALSTAAPGMVQMANAVAKWSTIEFPAGIEGNLTALANGVKSFALAFAGGWSLNAVVGPFGQLASAVNKWKDVTIPSGIQGNLTGLANGVKAFSTAFVGGWSLGAITEPLGNLAGSVKKWNGVAIPGGIQGNLTALANSVKAFADVGASATTGMTSSATALTSLSTSVTSLANSGIATIGTSLSNFITSLNNTLAVTSTLPDQLKSFATNLSTSMQNIATAISTNGSTISTGFTQFKASVTNGLSGVGSIVSQNMSSMSAAIIGATSTINGGLHSIVSVVLAFTGSMRNALNESTTSTAAGLRTTVDRINSFQSQFRTAGRHLADGLLNGMRSNSSQFTGVFSSSVNQVVNIVRGYYNGFYDAGRYLVEGFTNGIKNYASSAAIAAANMASSAKTAADRALDNGSPSKIMMQVGRFFTEGFSIGITDREDMVSNSSEKVAQKAISTLNDMLATSSIDDLFNASPTITPVLDLSAISKQAGSIDSMLSRSIAPSEAELREIDHRFRQNESGSRTAEKDTSGPKSVNIEYNQTLNSPTSLSRYDIYRQTSNQLKLLRQELKMSPIGK